jgi:transcriptional regulator with XRE-family HTH domain
MMGNNLKQAQHFKQIYTITDSDILRKYRKARRESQHRFWSRFGVTQSRGSRFELGVEIPRPVAILLKLYFDGVITDKDLLC